MKKGVVVLLLMIVCGCHSAMKTAYGIKKPRLETETSIKKYLVKEKVDTTGVLVFRDLPSFFKASQMNLMNVPEALFFNRNGNLVRYKKETETCNAKVDDFITDLSQFSNMQEDKSITISQFSGLLKGNASQQENADINVFITWTVYAGRLNKTKAFEWIRLLETAKSKGINVNYHLLNCDFQKNWNIPKEVCDQLGIKS